MARGPIPTSQEQAKVHFSRLLKAIVVGSYLRLLISPRKLEIPKKI